MGNIDKKSKKDEFINSMMVGNCPVCGSQNTRDCECSPLTYDINKEKSLRKCKFYYHVTAIENIDIIQKNGLKANEEGHIFVFTKEKVAESIAVNQCFLNKVALFMIDSRGITGKVIRDRVAEFVASYHRIIIQDKIPKKYVIFHHSWTIDLHKRFIEKHIQYGMSEAEAEKAYCKAVDMDKRMLNLETRKTGAIET